MRGEGGEERRGEEKRAGKRRLKDKGVVKIGQDTQKVLEKNMAWKSTYPKKTSHKRLIPEKTSLDKKTTIRTS